MTARTAGPAAASAGAEQEGEKQGSAAAKQGNAPLVPRAASLRWKTSGLEVVAGAELSCQSAQKVAPEHSSAKDLARIIVHWYRSCNDMSWMHQATTHSDEDEQVDDELACDQLGRRLDIVAHRKLPHPACM